LFQKVLAHEKQGEKCSYLSRLSMMTDLNIKNASAVQSVRQAEPAASPTTIQGGSDISLATSSGRNEYPGPTGTPASESFLGWGVLMTFLVVATAFLKSIK
jgi:hypothetical protein